MDSAFSKSPFTDISSDVILMCRLCDGSGCIEAKLMLMTKGFAFHRLKVSDMNILQEVFTSALCDEKPDIPQELRITRSTSRTIDISWSPPYSGNSRLLKYLLVYEEMSEIRDKISTGKNPSSDAKQVTIPPSETTWSINGLTPNTRYSIRISAVNALGESESSNPVEVATEEEGLLRGIQNEESKDKYVYKTLENKENFREERILTSLERNTKYIIRVQAFNSKGAGPPSDDVEGETLQEDPPRPPSLEVLGMTSSSVTLKWKKDTADTSPANGEFWVAK
ncbi:down syndrome cell adhesion molecule-like protein 1 [Trichonephila clavata]|uniref:Down syndrome cell adhesion molecule-like protein 1 n=1 Tax=Trichonephila clavata TaxID=2740835 RepID=A0A8X6KCJ4_TRICU|nr:down syndrome cell adhesion molecule-like protein 1 [Trichonephila clavata]